MQDPRKRWGAVAAIIGALASGGVALDLGGIVTISRPSDQEMMGPCPPPEHCPTALEMQSLRDRLKQEQEFRRQLGSRIHTMEERQNVLIAKEQATGEVLGTVGRSLDALKDVAQNLNTDAMNRNRMSTDTIVGEIEQIEGDLDEVAEDVTFIRKKVRRR